MYYFPGLSAIEAEKWCEGGVMVACQNAKDSVTLSGPKEAMEKVMEKLTAAEVFCRAVRSEGVAFHHPSLRAAAPRLLQELTRVSGGRVDCLPAFELFFSIWQKGRAL